MYDQWDRWTNRLTKIFLINFISFFYPLNYILLLFIELPSLKKSVTAGVAALLVGSGFQAPAQAFTKEEANSLSYLQVKGSGFANRCPEASGSGSINIGGKNFKVTDMCIEPKAWQVQETSINKTRKASKILITNFLKR